MHRERHAAIPVAMCELLCTLLLTTWAEGLRIAIARCCCSPPRCCRLHAVVGLAAAAHAARPTQQLKGLPPIITVKSLRTTTGPSYTFDVSSRLVQGLDAPLYPGQSATAKVAVDVARTKAGQGYLVTGRVIVTNPMRNPEALDVTGLKASWGPSIPLITPPPQALDCPGALLQAGESLSCSFRLELATSIIKTLTPIVLLKGLPQMQGEPLPLDWPSVPQQPSSAAEDTTGCALIQNQVIAGDMQPIVRISSSEEEAELMSSGIEVCSDTASFSYDVLVVSLGQAGPAAAAAGSCTFEQRARACSLPNPLLLMLLLLRHQGPFDDKSTLCGPYQVRARSGR
jgi:hypothetical protein